MLCYLRNIIVYSFFLVADYIHKCKRSDPEVAKCIQHSVEALKPRLKSGIPELDVPPIEPFIVPEVVISRGNNPQAAFRAILHNIAVSGASNFEITKIK